jgi:hypothetical protein
MDLVKFNNFDFINQGSYVIIINNKIDMQRKTL